MLKKFGKIIAYSLIGGFAWHLFFTWLAVWKLNYDYDKLIASLVVEQEPAADADSVRFARIEQRLNELVFEEFYEEFGSDAILKYEQYVRSEILEPGDVFLFAQQRGTPGADLYDETEEMFPDENVRIQSYEQHERDNRSNQLNPNNDSYWSSRGY